MIATWFFEVPPESRSIWRVVVWWEGSPHSIQHCHQLLPGEDAVEPMALIAAPFGIDLFYTLGWLVEVPARMLRPDLSSQFGPTLLKLGLGLGLVLSTLPAAFWVGYRLLQLLGAL